MANRSGDRARFNRRNKKFAKLRESARAHLAALTAAAQAKAPETKPKAS